ncbi:MAG: glycosyltransferase family 2 protein [Pseudomonadota bacterium]|nr:glycosyltransferase family 2 protein [Pseudomonadota bacterium]
MKSISIIIPCYNAEKFIEKNIRFLIKIIKKEKLSYQLILIDDGSTDNTKEIIKRLINKSIKKIFLPKNFGKSFAIKLALKSTKHKDIILIDCDLPYINKLRLVIKKLKNGYDFVAIDRRHRESSLKDEKLNIYQIFRYLVGMIISKIVYIFLPVKLNTYDTQAGLKGIRAFKNFKNFEFISKKFFLDLELFYLFIKYKKKFYFIPTNYKINKKSSIKFFSINSFKIIYELILVIINIRFNKYRYSNSKK